MSEPPEENAENAAHLRADFPKEVRLRKSSEFAAVYELRQSAADGLLIVNGRSNQLTTARIGLTVSRRVGNAVVRNRWKRCLREAFRQIRHRLPKLDLVVAPRPGAKPSVAEIMRSLPALAARVERRIRSGAAPYEPRAKQKRTKSSGQRKNSFPSGEKPGNGPASSEQTHRREERRS